MKKYSFFKFFALIISLVALQLFTTQINAQPIQITMTVDFDEWVKNDESTWYDATEFEHPECLAPERSGNRHMAFGLGPHYCPGAKLARLEIQIALQSFFTLFQELYPNDDPEFAPVWSENPNMGGYDEYFACPVFHSDPLQRDIV